MRGQFDNIYTWICLPAFRMGGYLAREALDRTYVMDAHSWQLSSGAAPLSSIIVHRPGQYTGWL